MNHHTLFGFVCFVAGLGSPEGLPTQLLILALLALGFVLFSYNQNSKVCRVW